MPIRYCPGGKSNVLSPAAVMEEPTLIQVEPSSDNVWNCMLPPPNVAETPRPYFPPPTNENAAVFAEIFRNWWLPVAATCRALCLSGSGADDAA
jgi:hypothetical protein